MAIRKKGTDDGFRGKTGREVIYELNGQIVKRTIGERTDKPTNAVLSVYQGTSVVSKFLESITDYIEVGYEIEARKARINYHNMACSYLRKNALTGTYPNVQLDYSKVLVSMGTMPPTQDVAMEVTADGLEFTWNNTAMSGGQKETDHVMLMAYFTGLEAAVYLINGASRTEGKDQMKLSKFKTPQLVEVYVSFIAANHKSVMNSIYMGQVIWDPLNGK